MRLESPYIFSSWWTDAWNLSFPRIWVSLCWLPVKVLPGWLANARRWNAVTRIWLWSSGGKIDNQEARFSLFVLTERQWEQKSGNLLRGDAIWSSRQLCTARFLLKKCHFGITKASKYSRYQTRTSLFPKKYSIEVYYTNFQMIWGILSSLFWTNTLKNDRQGSQGKPRLSGKKGNEPWGKSAVGLIKIY